MVAAVDRRRQRVVRRISDDQRFGTDLVSGQPSTLALVPQIVDAVNVPIIAAGGIGDGRGIAAAFALGAAGVQIGTAYLFCPEAAISPLYRDALRQARADTTVVTNVFTGHPARALANRLTRELGPFRRVWKYSPSSLELGFNYFDRGPHRFLAASDVLYRIGGELEQFEFHWTVADYVFAILSAGCQLAHIEEFGDACETWEGAPMTGLPAALLLVGQRDR